MHTLLFLLQATAPAATTPAAAPGGMSQGAMQLIFIGLLGIVFWFFIIGPQRKKQKESANYLNEIGKGSKIVTIGGIVGKVQEVRNKTFVIEVEGGGKLQILKSAVSLDNSRALNNEANEEKKEEKKDKKEKEEATA